MAVGRRRFSKCFFKSSIQSIKSQHMQELAWMDQAQNVLGRDAFVGGAQYAGAVRQGHFPLLLDPATQTTDKDPGTWNDSPVAPSPQYTVCMYALIAGGKERQTRSIRTEKTSEWATYRKLLNRRIFCYRSSSSKIPKTSKKTKNRSSSAGSTKEHPENDFLKTVYLWEIRRHAQPAAGRGRAPPSSRQTPLPNYFVCTDSQGKTTF